MIDTLFQSLDDYNFVGANIKGLVDDSVLGHIATDIGVVNEKMLSGGFMLFNPHRIGHFFLNNYNEDWIWLFLHLNGNKFLQEGEVYQKLSNPLFDYKAKVMFQEFGEIALDGVLDLYKGDSFEALAQLSFWERLVKERLEYLEMLRNRAVEANKRDYEDVITWIQANSRIFTAEIFRNLFQTYFENRIDFINLFTSL